jgi:hypothetical protein
MSEGMRIFISVVVVIAIFAIPFALVRIRLQRRQSELLDQQRAYQTQILAVMDSQLNSTADQTKALERIAAALEQRLPQSN